MNVEFLVLALSVFISTLSIAGLRRLMPDLLDGFASANYILFIIYISTYAAVWSLYFASPRLAKRFPSLLSLRVFLQKNSKQWTLNNSPIDQEIEDKILEKAKTSTTAISMLLAASVVALSQARLGWEKLGEKICRSPLDSYSLQLCTWNKLLYFGLAFSATIALISFAISADALDSMHNQFESSEMDNRYRRYFYRSAINPRYIGLSSLITSVIFINSTINIVLGSISIALVLSVGFRHWFISSKMMSEDYRENGSILGIWTRIIILCLAPLIAWSIAR